MQQRVKELSQVVTELVRRLTEVERKLQAIERHSSQSSIKPSIQVRIKYVPIIDFDSYTYSNSHSITDLLHRKQHVQHLASEWPVQRDEGESVAAQAIILQHQPNLLDGVPCHCERLSVRLVFSN
jgi:hypothetical protein